MVITVLIILLLVGGGVAVGIVLWVHQPWSNGWYGVEEKLKKMNGRSKYINYLTLSLSKAATSITDVYSSVSL